MPHHYAEIPALPVLLPVLALGLVAVVVHLRRTGAVTAARLVTGGLGCLYAVGVVRATLLPMPIRLGPDGNDVAWWVYVQVVPLLTADPTGIVLNLALFVPLGVLLPLLTPVRTLRHAALVGFAVSAGIEAVQFISDVLVSGGRVADVDDLIANTLGAIAGFALFRVAVAVPGLRRLVAAACWPLTPHLLFASLNAEATPPVEETAMPAMFVSLPVTDLERAKAFYSAVGFTLNPAFTDHNAACFVVEEDHSYLMILVREFFQTFTDLPIGDPKVNPCSSVSVFYDSREEVDATAARGLAAGATEPRAAADYGFMYQRGITDPDGNALEFGWMDPKAAETGPESFVNQQA